MKNETYSTLDIIDLYIFDIIVYIIELQVPVEKNSKKYLSLDCLPKFMMNNVFRPPIH
jgi:hypothetical protein